MLYFNSVKILRAILLTIFILGLASLSFAANDYYPGSIIVRFKPGVVKIPKGLAVAAARAATVSAASVKTLGAKYAVANYKKIYQAVLIKRPDWKQLEDDYLLTFPDEKGVINALNDFKKDQLKRLKDFKESLLMELYVKKLNTQKIAASPEEVDKYYNENLKDLPIPSRSPRSIFLSTIWKTRRKYWRD